MSNAAHQPPLNSVPDDLISYEEFLDRARFGRDGYRAMRRKGLAPTGYRLGRRLYFSEQEVQRWLVEVRVKPVPARTPATEASSRPNPPPQISKGPPDL